MSDGNNFGGGTSHVSTGMSVQDTYGPLLPEKIRRYMMFDSPISWCYQNMWQNWQQVFAQTRQRGYNYDQSVELFLGWLKQQEAMSYDCLLQEQNHGKAIKDRERHPAYREI